MESRAGKDNENEEGIAMGSIYLRGNKYWVKYYRNGKSYREPTHSDKKSVAERLLKLREGQVVEGKFPGLQAYKTTFEDLVKGLVDDYKLNDRKSLWRLEISLAHLQDHFKGWKAAHITSTSIGEYVLKRKEQGAKNGTVNRELSALKRAMSIAAQHTPPKIVSVPHFPKLKENNVRKGYFEPEEYMRLKEALPDYLKPVLVMAYHTGMRKGEILSLQWPQVNIFDRTITLEPGTTKNDEGRTVHLFGELYETVLSQRKRRDVLYPDCPWVFFLDGKQIGKDIRTAWNNACEKAGLNGKLFHDLRRTAVRNMVRAGIHETVAMKISGHKTRAVFDRYAISNNEDVRQGCELLASLHQERVDTSLRAQNGHNLEKIALIGGRK